MWAEASGEMRLAQAPVGEDTSALDKSIDRWAAITKDAGPLQADTTISGDTRNADYHVWPASTAAAWTMLAQTAPAFFAAPLPPATTLVTAWTKVRGGTSDHHLPGRRRAHGRDRRRTTCPRPLVAGVRLHRHLERHPRVRSAATASTCARASTREPKLKGYCVQLDKAYGAGEIVVREIEGDVEYSKPIARGGVPTGFAWYGVPHVVAVVMKGNTMTVSVDGARLLERAGPCRSLIGVGEVSVREPADRRPTRVRRLRPARLG